MERLGTQITAPVVIQDDAIPAPSAYINHIAGGAFKVNTLADLLAIPEYYRRDINGTALWGMTGWVHSDTTSENIGEWEIIKGLSSTDIMDNANWRKKQQGAISANDVNETPERVFITPADRDLIRNDKGHHETEADLNTDYPVGESGWYAVVEFTNTFWVWSVGSSAWVNSGNAATSYVHPNHTGDVTSVGDGATTITPKAVTNSKLADMAANTFKMAIASGEPIDGTVAQAKTALGVPTVVNNLTSVSTTDALAAAQGKALKGLIDKQFYLGAARTPGIVYDEIENEEIVTLSWNGFKEDFWEKAFDIPGPPFVGIRIVINNNSNPTPWVPWQGIISIVSGNEPNESQTHILKLPSGDDSENNYISIRIPLGDTQIYRFYRRYSTTYWQYLGNKDEIGGIYPDETTTAPNIVSSGNLAIGHAGTSKINPVLSASLVNITVQPEATVPIPVGQTFNYAQDGAGQINFIAETGVTIKSRRNTSSEIKTAAQYDVITLVYEGSDVWRAFGGIETT